MASPASTTAHKPPQLSYAAQAKKARNIQPQNSSPAPRAISQTVSVSSTATVISAVPSTSSTTSIAVSPSDPPKPFQPVDTRDQAPATSTVNLPRPSAPMSPIRLESTKKDIQGDVTAEFADSSANEAPPARSQKSASLPPVNVWKKREEQRAQLAQSQAQITVPPPTQHRPAAADPLEKTFPTLNSRSSDTPSGPPSSSFQANNAPVNVSKVSSSLKPPANGQHPPEEHADPFVVRPNLVPSVRLPLAAVDNDNWPTIGDAVPVPSLPSSHGTSDNPIHDPGEQKEKSEEKDTGNIAPKKGEKTKWVAIPAEELQAAADAQHRPHRHRNGNSRPRSQYQSHKSHAPTSGSTSTTGSISGQNSQGQSRTHSAMGTRQPGSHVNSVSHSQAQSRTGSTHSSPRQPGRGGRQLPDEVNPSRLPVPDVLTAANRSSKSSRATSPQPQGYPGQPSQDPASTIQSTTALYPDPNAPQPHASQLLDPPFSEVGHTHYASIPPPLSSNTSQSYHSTHASNSPASNPYPLPVPAPVPTMYPLPSTIPANLPGHPYPGNPPFVGYPPYDYVYGAPYMHWPQGPDAVGSYPLPPHTHAYTGGLKLGQDSALPSSSTSRPPPPAESDPVAAYRDMGFVLPPPAAYTGGEPTDMERGRRRRELSFGTIGPSAGSPTSSSVSVEHGNEGIVQSVLELDIVDQTKKDGTESGEAILEKSFSGFSIGVSPGEPGPSRIRSRTRTQPKSVPTPRERVKTAPADLGGRRSEASRGDPMAEVNASVESSNLGEESSKWEFGTANHPEQDAQAPSNAVESHSYVKSSGELLTPSVAPGIGYIAVPQPLVEAHPQHQPPYAQRMGLSPLTTSSNGIPPSHSPSSAGVPYSVASGVSPSGQVHQTQDWEVKNFGWGFGQPNGALVSPGTHRDEQRPRDREGREYQRESGGGRPRRGSYGGAYGYDNRGGHERGGYPSRRGRGNGGFNRGFHGRNFSRGTYQQSHQSRQPPFNMTQTQTPPMPHPADHNPYYPLSPQTPLGTTYFHPAGYDPYAYTPYPPMPAPAPAQPGPPLPIPQTDVLFPLDSTTYYLLGQLEYYLSAQNLAQDIFLRKQMDDRGWIHIPVIAAFNRVTQLTHDLQRVKEVMRLSSLVEVHEDWVRTRDWRPFVLPNAQESVVGLTPYDVPPIAGHSSKVLHQTEDLADAESTSHEGEEEDEEDDQVEIVMDSSASQSWTSERNSG